MGNRREAWVSGQGEDESERPRALLERVQHWLSDHDPGGVDSTRALHLAISFVLVIALGYVTAVSFDIGMDILFPMAGAMTTLVLITFTPSASRRLEAVSFLKIFGLTFAMLGVVVLIGPGNAPLNALVLKLLLVPLTGVALYLRRYGMEGMRLGIVIIIMATVCAILHPTRMETLWLLVAACQGMVVSCLVRFLLWRPSALQVYAMTVEQAGAAIGAYLNLVGVAVRENRPMPVPTEELLDQIRLRVRSALTNASAEAPQARPYLEAVRSRAYRLRVATQLLGEAIPAAALSTEGDQQAWRAPLAAAADQLARHLENGIAQPFPEQARMNDILARLRQTVMSQDLPTGQQLSLLRAANAFVRLALVISELATLTMAGPKGWRGTPSPPPPPALPTPPGLSPYAKVALQGVVATAITTSLDLWFALDHAYWATMTVMFVLGNSVGETYVRVRYRTLGTLVGVVIGLVAISAFASHVWVLAAACLIGQMIGLVTNRDRYDIASAAVGLSVVVALHLVTGLGADGMVARIYETAIGAAVALAVSWIVLPVYVADQIRTQVLTMVRRCRDAFADSWPRREGNAGDARNITAGMSLELRLLADRLPHIGAETTLGHRNAADVITLVSTLEILTTYLALLEDAAIRLSALSPREELVTVLESARFRTLRAFDIALGEAAPLTKAPSASELDATISVALDLASDTDVRRLLPFIADYLSFADAVLRPLADLGKILAASAPRSPRPT